MMEDEAVPQPLAGQEDVAADDEVASVETSTETMTRSPSDGGPGFLTDPAGYALAWSPGLGAAIAACEDTTLAAELLLGAQAALGIPEGRRSPWTPAECEALVEEWLMLEAEHAVAPGMAGSLARARVRLAFLRQHLLAFPPRLRPAAQDTLEALGLGGRRPGLLRAMALALERGNLVQAYSLALQDLRLPEAAG